MQIQITNFRGVKHAEITAEKITLVAGRNHQGKTSVIQAIAAAMTGKTVPIEGLKKSHAGRLVRSGTVTGEVEVYDDNGHASVVYPDASRSTSGYAPEIDEYAAGILSLVDMPTASRSEAIADLIQSRPTTEELTAELLNNCVGNETVKRICDTVKAQGWDAAHAQAKEKGARLKGQWENEAGTRYGVKKAADWVPAEWTNDLETASVEQLEKDIETERHWLEAAISHEAVEMAETESLQKAVEAGSAASEASINVTKEINTLLDDEAAARKVLAGLPQAKQPSTAPCPHCGELIAVENGTLQRPEILSEKEIAARAENITKARKYFDKVKRAVAEKSAELARLKGVIASGASAKDRINSVAEKHQSTVETRGSVDDCRARVDRAEARLSALLQRERAAALHKSVIDIAEIVRTLAPDGLRMSKLQRSLKSFNEHLSTLSAAAKWGRVFIGQDMQISYNGTPYMLCSESEQFRARVTMQVAAANTAGACVVLIDRADILDSSGRNGMTGLLLSAKMPDIVAMTINSKDVVPPVAKIGGVAYWIENGLTEAL